MASMKEARFGHACGILNHKEIIVAGGKNGIGNSLRSTEICTLTNLEWKIATQLPETLDGGVGLQHGTTLLILGNPIYEFDETSYKWALRDEASLERSGYVAIPITGTHVKSIN